MQVTTSDYALIGVLGLMLLSGMVLGLRRFAMARSYTNSEADTEFDQEPHQRRSLVMAVASLTIVLLVLALTWNFTPLGSYAAQLAAPRSVAAPTLAVVSASKPSSAQTPAVVTDVPTTTASPSATATPTKAATSTSTATPAPTKTATATVTVTASPELTSTPVATETPTLEPSATVEATPAATEQTVRALQTGELYGRVSERITLRELPSSRSREVSEIEQGAVVILVGRVRGSTWIKVEHNNVSGWLAGNLVEAEGNVNRLPILRR
jgi:hypothetical protein